MMNYKEVFVTIVLFLSTFIYNADGFSCNVCLRTTLQSDCGLVFNCGENIGCFSQTWVTSGVRYYEKGCQQPAVTDCEGINDAFCTPDLALLCCASDGCNAPDPVAVWRPESPRNVILTELNPTSVALSWDIQCNGIYSYQVEYYIKGQSTTSFVSTTTSEASITELVAESEYVFDVRSFYDGRLGDAARIERTTPAHNITRYTFCARTDNSTLLDTTSTTLQTCEPNEQLCFTILNYYSQGGATYVTRGCATPEACDFIVNTYRDACIPGLRNAFCNFCCEGSACNNENDAILSNLTCNGIEQSARVDCGWEGIDEATCSSRGCCYEESSNTSYDKWCYHKVLGSGYEEPTTIAPPLAAGLDLWIIIVISVGAFLVILIILIIVYIAMKRRMERKKGFYGVDSIYATPDKSRSRRVNTVSRPRISSSCVTIEEST